MAENDGTPETADETVVDAAPVAPVSTGPRFWDRAWSVRAMVAVGLAALVLGGGVGSAIAAVSSDDDGSQRPERSADGPGNGRGVGPGLRGYERPDFPGVGPDVRGYERPDFRGRGPDLADDEIKELREQMRKELKELRKDFVERRKAAREDARDDDDAATTPAPTPSPESSN